MISQRGWKQPSLESSQIQKRAVIFDRTFRIVLWVLDIRKPEEANLLSTISRTEDLRYFVKLGIARLDNSIFKLIPVWILGLPVHNDYLGTLGLFPFPRPLASLNACKDNIIDKDIDEFHRIRSRRIVLLLLNSMMRYQCIQMSTTIFNMAQPTFWGMGPFETKSSRSEKLGSK